MPRGGKRAGAGAPEGNFNAMTHGRRSRQLRQLFIAMMGRTRARQLVGKARAAALLTKAGLVRRRKGTT